MRQLEHTPLPTKWINVEQSRLVEHYAESAIRLAYHITRNREAALDLSQEAMLLALERLHELRDPMALKSWFNRILVNLCRDWLSRRGLEAKGLEQARKIELRSSPVDPAWQAERKESFERTRQALMGLPLEYRETLALILVEGVSCKEASGILQAPEGTVRWRLHEGKRLLREILEA